MEVSVPITLPWWLMTTPTCVPKWVSTHLGNNCANDSTTVFKRTTRKAAIGKSKSLYPKKLQGADQFLCFFVNSPNSSVSQGNNEPCIVIQYCDKVSLNLLI